MKDWEEIFKKWASPPGTTEQNRCDNAVSAIRNAIDASKKLQSRNITVFAQGSYKNNTNVRQDSDVDVGVLCTDTFFFDLPEGTIKESFGIVPASYYYEQFKNEVHEALRDYFGTGAVRRGNKAIDVHETSYHVEADVAPFFEHRRFSGNRTYASGVELRPDNDPNRKVINWPTQHYNNGVHKNKETGRRYKSIVRILKAISNEMTSKNIPSSNIPGFLIECLVWNIPNASFQKPTLTDDIRVALIYLYQQTVDLKLCKDWGEVSELKYLFRGPQKWTHEQANAFVVAAWKYIGFEA